MSDTQVVHRANKQYAALSGSLLLCPMSGILSYLAISDYSQVNTIALILVAFIAFCYQVDPFG